MADHWEVKCKNIGRFDGDPEEIANNYLMEFPEWEPIAWGFDEHWVHLKLKRRVVN